MSDGSPEQIQRLADNIDMCLGDAANCLALGGKLSPIMERGLLKIAETGREVALANAAEIAALKEKLAAAERERDEALRLSRSGGGWRTPPAPNDPHPMAEEGAETWKEYGDCWKGVADKLRVRAESAEAEASRLTGVCVETTKAFHERARVAESRVASLESALAQRAKDVELGAMLLELAKARPVVTIYPPSARLPQFHVYLGDHISRVGDTLDAALAAALESIKGKETK